MTALAHIMPGPPPVDPRADAIEREVERLRGDRAWLIEHLDDDILAFDSSGVAEAILSATELWPGDRYDPSGLPTLHQSTKGYRMDIDDLVLAEATRRVDAEIYAAEDE